MLVEQIDATRAALHRALGDPHRLAIVDALWASDRTSTELRQLTGMRSNLLAFHLDVLDRAGLVIRHHSEGDGRRRYVALTTAAVPHARPVADLMRRSVLFVCTRNAARSQIAAALWRARLGGRAASAGTCPAARVHPHAVAVAAAHGLDISHARPQHIDDVTDAPELVVSVCDRAHEAGVGRGAPHHHWSIPDPVDHDRRSFAHAFAMLAERIDRLAIDVSPRPSAVGPITSDRSDRQPPTTVPASTPALEENQR